MYTDTQAEEIYLSLSEKSKLKVLSHFRRVRLYIITIDGSHYVYKDRIVTIHESPSKLRPDLMKELLDDMEKNEITLCYDLSDGSEVRILTKFIMGYYTKIEIDINEDELTTEN